MATGVTSVRGIRVRTVNVPMKEPHRTAGGVVSSSPLVLTDIETDSGVVGHSIVFTYTPVALKPTADLIRNLEPLVVGKSLAPADLEQSLAKRFRLLGTQGLVGIALAAIDMALWDALARLHDMPLVRLLGGTPRPVRCYGPVGYDGANDSARSAAAWVERGMLGVKAKIGYPTLAEDIAVVRAIRKAVGSDIHIMVDYNQSLLPVEATKRLRALDQEGLTWVEEPTLAHDYAGHALISREIQTPIQCGENWWGTLDMQHAIAAGASDLIMMDVMKIGGVTGWMRGTAIAHSCGIPISSHLWPELSAHLMCCTPTADWIEYVDFWNPLLEEPLQIKEGCAMPAETPGSGMNWNEDAVSHYAV